MKDRQYNDRSTSTLANSNPKPNPNPNPNPNHNPYQNPNPNSNPNGYIRIITKWKVMGHTCWLLKYLTFGVRQSRFYTNTIQKYISYNFESWLGYSGLVWLFTTLFQVIDKGLCIRLLDRRCCCPYKWTLYNADFFQRRHCSYLTDICRFVWNNVFISVIQPILFMYKLPLSVTDVWQWYMLHIYKTHTSRVMTE